MKNLTVVFSLLVLAGCASTPLKKDTVLAPYDTAIVKDVQVVDTTFSKIQGDETTLFKESQPELIARYTANLKKNLEESSLFSKVTSDGKAPGKAVIIESRTQLVDAGIRALQPTTSVIGVNIKDAGTGNLICSYDVTSHTGRQIWTTMMGSLRDDFANLGAEAANHMTKGCVEWAVTLKQALGSIKRVQEGLGQQLKKESR